MSENQYAKHLQLHYLAIHFTLRPNLCTYIHVAVTVHDRSYPKVVSAVIYR